MFLLFIMLCITKDSHESVVTIIITERQYLTHEYNVKQHIAKLTEILSLGMLVPTVIVGIDKRIIVYILLCQIKNKKLTC